MNASQKHEEKLVKVLSALQRAGFGNLMSARPATIARAVAQLAHREDPTGVFAAALEILAGALEVSDKSYEVMRDTMLAMTALAKERGEPVIVAAQKNTRVYEGIVQEDILNKPDTIVLVANDAVALYPSVLLNGLVGKRVRITVEISS